MRTVHIPAGINCDVTSFLLRTGRRREAMPFDWTMCTLDRIADLIENDFSEWMTDLLYMRVKARTYMDARVKTPMHEVWCARSGVLFLHDFEAGDGDCETRAREKYDRRISRFRKLCESGKYRVMFVTDLSGESNARNAKFLRGVAEDEPISPSREDISRQIDRLADVVSRKYPGLEFAVARLVKGQRLAIARNFVPIQ